MFNLQRNSVFVGVFLILHLVNVIANGIEYLAFLRYLTQPGLTFILIYIFWTNSNHMLPQERYFIIAALSCLLIGDIALFSHNSEPWFLVGMIFFLLANIMYALALQFNSSYSLGKVLIIGGLMLAYAYSLLTFIVGGLGAYYIPVIIFMVSVFGLVQTAFSRYGVVNNLSFWLVFIGSCFFLVSVLIIALNKFYKPLPYGNLLSLFFYGASQLLMVVGFLKQNLQDNNKLVLSNQTQ